MRIIAGTARGRRLASFKGISIRPTTDRVRESIFNILPRPFPYKKTLDLFAGTGAMGIEAFSRGALTVTFVDNSPKALQIVRKNLETCGFSDRAVLLCMDVEAAVQMLGRKNEQFDLIFIDPPYNASLTEAVLREIVKAELLDKGGLIVAESSKRAWSSSNIEGLECIDRRRYGDTALAFYRHQIIKDENEKTHSSLSRDI